MTPIQLENTVFDFKRVVQLLPRTMAFKGKELKAFTDFGTLFVGFTSDELQNLEEVEHFLNGSCPQKGAPIFTAPLDWRMPQVLKALGAFKSTSEARKNGWDKNIEVGCSEHIIRVNKILGALWVHKKNS